MTAPHQRWRIGPEQLERPPHQLVAPQPVETGHERCRVRQPQAPGDEVERRQLV